MRESDYFRSRQKRIDTFYISGLVVKVYVVQRLGRPMRFFFGGDASPALLLSHPTPNVFVVFCLGISGFVRLASQENVCGRIEKRVYRLQCVASKTPHSRLFLKPAVVWVTIGLAKPIRTCRTFRLKSNFFVPLLQTSCPPSEDSMFIVRIVRADAHIQCAKIRDHGV